MITILIIALIYTFFAITFSLIKFTKICKEYSDNNITEDWNTWYEREYDVHVMFYGLFWPISIFYLIIPYIWNPIANKIKKYFNI